MKRGNTLTTLVTLALVALPGLAALAQTYTATDLGTLPKTDTSIGLDVNDRGEVVGHTVNRGRYQNSFYWSAATGMVDMGFFAVNGLHINNLGQVLSGNTVWRYGQNGNRPLALPDIRTPGDGGIGGATDINDNGEISGASDTNEVIGYDGNGVPQYASAPAIWKQVSGVWTAIALPVPAGDNRGGAHQLTNLAQDGSGQAIGMTGQVVFDAAGTATVTAKHLVRWTRAGDTWVIAGSQYITGSPSFGGQVMNAAGDSAGYISDPAFGDIFMFVERGSYQMTQIAVRPRGIDGDGNVVGSFLMPEGSRAVRRLRSDGSIVSLGTLGGTVSSAVNDNFYDSFRVANESGTIVGSSTIAGDKDTHAFVWTAASGMRDLDSVAVTTNKAGFSILRSASAVSNTGYIAGKGILKKGGFTHAFLLTPR